MSVLKELGFVGEGVVDRVFEVGHMLKTADGDVMRFDVVPDGFMAPMLTPLL